MRIRLSSKAPCASKRRAVAATELALILPLLMLILLGAVDFGRFAYNYIAVINAARAGAAYGIMNNYSAKTLATWQSNVTQAAKDEMTQQVGSGNIANLQVTATGVDDGNGYHSVVVKTQYPFTTLVKWNVAGYGLPSSVTLTGQVKMRIIR